ncbi:MULTISPECIES: 3-hydroxyacyl-ACP dehydratase FabZ family protein [Aequorivita]|uniref:Hydroxymyristoyl-ACP dehydratase n=2 Tax=Aequorivita TaxID=153265 RepID=A0AB35YP05_9FLAO|nr:hydroxymyristoyl-ACP dehydratase [Aequorivita sp. Ant34-E75]WGF91997.1 hydroxymyristoyl-ACP dehydratase [Aequorivita sp. Ant34-E75]
MKSEEIIAKLPYSEPFLFVNNIQSVSAEGICGTYFFGGNSYFYKGHFKNKPVTPGVILTECMAQIGLVCFGIFLFNENQISGHSNFALSNTQIDFFAPVFPEETVKVISEKIYFRFNKLKCNVKMLNSKNEIVAKGTISGMLLNETNLI